MRASKLRAALKAPAKPKRAWRKHPGYIGKGSMKIGLTSPSASPEIANSVNGKGMHCTLEKELCQLKLKTQQLFCECETSPAQLRELAHTNKQEWNA